MTAVFDATYYKQGSKKTGTYAEYDFDKYVQYYEKIIPFITRHIAPQSKVLDLGCARGSSTFALRKAGLNAYGIDISRHAIESAPQTISPYLQAADLNFWQPGDRRYDSILCFGVLEYLNSMSRALETLSSTLDSNGWVFIKTLSSTVASDKLRVSCLPREEFIALAKKHGLQYDEVVSKDFERNGLVALHEFSIENPESLFKKLYKMFYRVFGLGPSLKALKASNRNLEFIALRKV